MKEVTDKDLIVYLVAKGFEVKRIIKDPVRQRCLVYFDNSAELEKGILDFANKNTSINIGEFIAADRRVKTLLQMQKS